MEFVGMLARRLLRDRTHILVTAVLVDRKRQQAHFGVFLQQRRVRTGQYSALTDRHVDSPRARAIAKPGVVPLERVAHQAA
jgi:hypothetical protein